MNRNFHSNRLAEKWVSDLTYIKTQEGWLYLTAVMDLADRKVVDWALSQTMEAEMTSVAARQMAVKNRPITQLLLFHSDRGAGVCLPGIQKATYRSASATEYEQKRQML